MAQKGRKKSGTAGGSGGQGHKARSGRGKARTAAAKGRSGAQASRPERRSIPGWAWLLVGAALGAGALFFLQYQQQGGGEADPASGNPAGPSEPQAEQRPDEEPSKEQEQGRQYEFYEMLMQDEVSVPEEDLSEADERRSEEEEREELSRATNFEEGQRYLLQAGSFQHHEDAESMRASLALVGLPAQIHTVELQGGEEWHRVRVGPFEDRGRIEEARSRMEKNDIEPLMLRQEG
ncbi:MAG: SPOR domain-containing protein [Halorhodospira sp.]